MQELFVPLNYRVSVRFSSDGMLKITGNEISVSLRSAPVRGRANHELVKILSRYFKVEPSRVRIVSGQNSRKKIIEII